MESKGCKRFATTTEAEIEEKRLKLNAERTIKQKKAAVAILKDSLFILLLIINALSTQHDLCQCNLTAQIELIQDKLCPRKENLNLLVRIKFLNLFYMYI
jgi:hypothetical protein